MSFSAGSAAGSGATLACATSHVCDGISGTATLTSGVMSGSGTTTLQSGVTLTGTSDGLDGGRDLVLQGTSVATGTSAVSFNLNAANGYTGESDAGYGTLTIASGATFNDQTS